MKSMYLRLAVQDSDYETMLMAVSQGTPVGSTVTANHEDGVNYLTFHNLPADNERHGYEIAMQYVLRHKLGIPIPAHIHADHVELREVKQNFVNVFLNR